MTSSNKISAEGNAAAAGASGYYNRAKIHIKYDKVTGP